jgi:hypothetical protein
METCEVQIARRTTGLLGFEDVAVPDRHKQPFVAWNFAVLDRVCEIFADIAARLMR